MWIAAMVCAAAPAAPAWALRVAAPAVPPADAALTADVLAEVKLVAVVAATADADGVAQLAVSRQAGFVTLPERIHLVLPRTTTVQPLPGRIVPAGGRPLPEVGKSAVLAFHLGRGGLPWTADPPLRGAADWPLAEAIFEARRRLADAADPAARERLLAGMISGGKPAEFRVAMAAERRGEPSAEVLAALAKVDPDALPKLGADGRAGPLLAAGWKARPTAELIRLTAGSGGAAAIAANAATEALVLKALAGDAEAVAHWTARLESKNQNDRDNAARGLMAAGADPAVRAALIKRLESMDKNEYRDFELAAAIAGAGPEGLDYAVDCLSGKRPAPMRANGWPRISPTTGTQLRSADPARLTALLDHGSAEVRAFAARALGTIGHAAAAGRLESLYADAKQDEQVRAAAGEAVLRLEVPAAIALAEKLLTTDAQATFSWAVKPRGTQRADLRFIALTALGRMTGSPEAAALLGRLAEAGAATDGDEAPPRIASLGAPQTARMAAVHLAGNTTPAAEAALIALLGKPAEWARQQAVRSLTGRRTPAVRAALLAAARTAPEAVLPALAADPEALAAYAGEFAKSRSADRPAALVAAAVKLIAELDHAEFDVREKATADLAKLGPAVRPEVAAAAADRSPERSSRAKLVLAALDDPSRVRPGAVAMCLAPDAAFVPVLTDLLESTDAGLRAIAADALSRLAVPTNGYDPIGPEADRRAAVARIRAAGKGR
jgi:HEAT repeat protein